MTIMKSVFILVLGFIHWYCAPSAKPDGPPLDQPVTIAGAPDGRSQNVVYFKAKGTSPRWELQIAEDRIAFASDQPGFEAFNAAHVEPTRAADMNVKKYSLQTESGMMDIQIIQTPCQMADSREGFSYKVDVWIKRGTDSTFTTFSGCGVYVTDMRFNGNWTVLQIKDKVVSAKDFPDKLPSIDIKSNANAFTGFAGCNTISGRIFFEKNLLRFTDVVATKMSCPASSQEASFLNALKFSTQYSIHADTLMLSYPGVQTLVFMRSKQ